MGRDYRDKKTGRQTGRQTERQKSRQASRQAEHCIDSHTFSSSRTPSTSYQQRLEAPGQFPQALLQTWPVGMHISISSLQHNLQVGMGDCKLPMYPSLHMSPLTHPDQFLLAAYINGCAGVQSEGRGSSIGVVGRKADSHPNKVATLFHLDSAAALGGLQLKRKG